MSRIRPFGKALVAVLRRFLVAGTLLVSQAPAAEVPALPGAQQLLVMLRLPPSHFRPEGDYGGAWGGGPGQASRRRVADELARHAHLRVVSAWPMMDLGVECFVMEPLDPHAPSAPVMARLAADPRVESVQAMHDFRTLGHDDPLFPAQPAATRWRLADLHKATTGRGIRVAVIDSGVDRDHPDLKGQVVRSANLVDAATETPEIHGTAVAGIISARADDGIGIVGVAPGARLYALRACWEVRPDTGEARCNSFTLAKALQAALEFKVDVINMSLSGPGDDLLGRLINVALQRGMTVVGASASADSRQEFPASHPGVLAASSLGDAPQPGALLVPGRDVPTAMPGRRWGLVTGASFAAAHLSGLVALLRDLDHEPGAWVRATTSDAQAARNSDAATGVVDACALVAEAARRCICDCDVHPHPMH